MKGISRNQPFLLSLLLISQLASGTGNMAQITGRNRPEKVGVIPKFETDLHIQDKPNLEFFNQNCSL